MKKILILHPTGNANVRSTIHGLYKHNLLNSYHTSIACFKGSLLYKLSHLFKDIKKREYPIYIKPKTYTYPFKESFRLLTPILNKYLPFNISFISKRCTIDIIYNDLDKRVSSYINKQYKQIQSIYAYEDCAYNSFIAAKGKNIKCIYELPSIYWKAKNALLANEKIKNPQWVDTIISYKESKEKLQKKDYEIHLSDIILVASTFTKSTLEYYFPQISSPIKVIPYGFPPINKSREYNNFINRKIKVLFVGGLMQNKGLSYLFESIQGLEEYIELTVIGKGNINECPALEKALKGVIYIPSLPHDEILRCMAEHDVFIFPSLFEGFGLVITEAMSQGTPVITTERTCAPDIITHGKDGWIVKAGETAPIRELLKDFIKNPQILQTVGKEAMKTASKRPWHCYEDDLINTIKDFNNDYIFPQKQE